MARRDLSTFDASHHAASELEYVIRAEKKLAEPEVPTVTAEQAMRGERVYTTASERNVTRVLFISRNTELLNPTKQSLDGYIDISDLFSEVHILILRHGIPAKNPVLRVADNVWIYTASSRFWWRTPNAGIQMVEDQLVFASGFRPDLIVARDPFESAFVAHKLSEHYHRPAQVHILEDFTEKDFIAKDKTNRWRLRLMRWLLPKFSSVRTQTDNLQAIVQKRWQIPDLSTLPRFQDYEGLITLQEKIDLKNTYKPFVFFMLYVGELTHQSTVYRAIDAARFVLRNPRVGLIVLGDGPARSEFVKRTKILGIERQVVFEPKIEEEKIAAYMKSANILLITDTDQASDRVALQGAAAGIPMILSKTEKRNDLFVDGESAYLCEPEDVQGFSNRINELLNSLTIRRQFTELGQDMIRQRFHTDPDEYREAYRMSIEQAFFSNTDTDEDQSSAGAS